MLTMDVADTLRHNRSVVERELNADARDEALKRKVRDIYASQGIEVSDQVIEEAVKSLRDERFAYSPPPGNFTTRLWRLYVQRGKWKKKLWMGFAALLAAWGIHYGTVTIPQSRDVAHQIKTLNENIRQADLVVEVLTQQQERLRNRLQDAQRKFPVTLQETANGIRRDVSNSIEQSVDILASARKLSQDPDIRPGDLVVRKQSVQQRLTQQTSLLAEARQQLDKAESMLDLLDRLEEVPQTLDNLLAQIRAVAAEPAAIRLAEDYHTDGLAAMRNRNGGAINKAVTNLKTLLTRLEAEYDLRIVVKPGVKSGVWRYPDSNSNARNYYLIVEAISPQGERLTLPVESEEDGSIKEVSKWGVRVSQTDFERVAADKQDNGIIENNIIGSKQRGYLNPRYRINNTGGTITKW